jgi:hypothetical protein
VTDFAWYAWCFDHGCMHRFKHVKTAWCAARWRPFDAYDEQSAIGMKRDLYGDAKFLHELTDEQQLNVIEQAARRNQQLANLDEALDVEAGLAEIIKPKEGDRNGT